MYEVSGGLLNFYAVVYMCTLNCDNDGAPNAYGYDNPAQGSVQHDLDPIEFWRPPPPHPPISKSAAEISGLGNACGDPGDKSGAKGFDNFFAGNRKFWWAGIQAETRRRAAALHLTIDDRPELEAGLKEAGSALLPVGSGYFPVVNPQTGYYISGTSLHADESSSQYNPQYYLDATVVPYAVRTSVWDRVSLSGGLKLRMGDFGLAIQNDTGIALGFVYGDGSGGSKLGECSRKLWSTLGKGAGLVTFIAFPGSGSGKVVNGAYKPDPLGPSPEALIPKVVSKHMFRIKTSVPDLATLLSRGSTLSTPARSFASPDQARLYKSFTTALSPWS